MFLSGKLLYQNVYNKPLSVKKGLSAALKQLSFISKVSIMVLSISSLLWIMQKLNNTVILPIRHIKVMGQLPVHAKERITRTILPFTQKGLLKVNAHHLKDSLQQWSWVEAVTVKRVLPNSVVVQVNARQPIAHFRNIDDNVMHCLDKNGYMFECEKETTLPENMAYLTGPLYEAKYLLQLYQKITQMFALYAVKVAQLNMDNQRRVSIKLDNGIQLHLGHRHRLQQLKKLLTMHPLSLYQSSQIATIDLRYPRGMAIVFHEPKITT